MKLTTWLRRTAIVLSSSGAMAMSAQADDTNSQSYELDIDALPLTTAVKTLSDETGIEVLYFSEIAEGVTSSPVQGEYTPTEALETMLTSTDLEVVGLDKEGAVAIASTAFSQGGDSEQKNLNPAPVLMAQNVSQTETSTATSRRQSSEGGTSIVTGKVTDARTGANLKGAKVTIEETGQWTSTNDLGEFRLVNVPTGSATLTVSYLGYAGQSAVVGIRGEGTSQNFALRGGSEIEEIVVFGQRSARALALNQERTAANFTTVLSADQLGRFEGTTIAESLRRAPGIAFVQDDRSSDGTNIIVRGLAPDFNMVTLNGLRLPVGDGEGRSPALNNLLTEAVSKVTISKTLLPSQDSSGTGGLVEIETKRPLDRGRRFAAVNVQTGRTSKDFREDAMVSATVAGTFGERSNFGMSLSAQKRQNDITSIRYTSFDRGSLLNDNIAFEYLPLSNDGSTIASISQIDPRTPFPFEAQAELIYPNSVESRYTRSDVENSSVTFSAQWRPKPHTDLNFDYTFAKVDKEEFLRAVTFGSATVYEPLSIDELGGEIRGASVWEDAFAGFGLPGALGGVILRHTLEKNESETSLLSLHGSTTISKWSLHYSVGHTVGELSRPIEGRMNVRPTIGFFGFVDVLPEWLLPEATSNTVEGRMVSAFPALNGQRGFILPLLNETGFAFFNDGSNYALESLDLTAIQGENKRSTGRMDVRYDVGHSVFNRISVGAFFETSRSSSLLLPGQFVTPIGDPTLAALGLTLSDDNLSSIGLNGGFRGVSETSLTDLVNGAILRPDLSVFEREIDERNRDTYLDEDNAALYVEGQLSVGELEIVGGFRFDSIDIESRNITNPTLIDSNGNPDQAFAEEFRSLVTQSASQDEILPRVLLNYRYTDNLIFRGGFFRSVARPQVRQLSKEQTLSLNLQPVGGPFSDQPTLLIIEGNPGLKPAFTDNYDLSVEYYDADLGQLKFSLFYKEIKNFLEFNSNTGTDLLDGAVLPNDPRFQSLPEDIFVQRVRPFNNDEPARIWGAELALEKQLTMLPGNWGGLGVFANYTYSDSSKKVFDEFFDQESGETVQVVFDDVPFAGQPEHSGTFAITYNMNNVDASLAYTRQDRRLRDFSSFSLHTFFEEDESLDFRFTYFLDSGFGDWRLYIEGVDLLKSSDDQDVEESVGGVNGAPTFFANGSYFGGRVFRVGVSATFQ